MLRLLWKAWTQIKYCVKFINADEINAVDINSNTLFKQEAEVNSIFTVPSPSAYPSTVVGSIDGEIMMHDYNLYGIQ